MQSQICNQAELDPKTRILYYHALKVLTQSQVPFLITGAYAFDRYTGIQRHSRGLDVIVRPQHCQRILAALCAAGYRTEFSPQNWSGKAFCGENFVCIIFNSPSCHGAIEDSWFERAVADELLGIPVQLCSPEDLIWSKAFIMDRQHFDGADVAHLLYACSQRLDWSYLLYRFGCHWRVLFSHLILFGFIYPSERSRIPAWVMQELSERLQREMSSVSAGEKLCQGTLLSELQYQIDVDCWGYEDGRLHPHQNQAAA